MEESSVAQDLPAAGFWVRAGAAVIDGIILIPVTVAIGIGLAYLFQTAGLALARLVAVAVPLVYYTVGFAVWGQTLGKAAAGVQVVSLDGGPLGSGRALVRAMGYVLSTFLFMLGYLIAAFTPNKRGLHDYLAGSRVVYPAPVSEARKRVMGAIGALGCVLLPLAAVLFALASRSGSGLPSPPAPPR